MGEHHEIAGPAVGAPRARGDVGALVSLPLDGPPTPQWSAALSAHLACGLTGHPAVGHMRLNGVVQGSSLVLEGVEPAEADLLGAVVRDAIVAANHACDHEEGAGGATNMAAAQAAELAKTVAAGAAG